MDISSIPEEFNWNENNSSDTKEIRIKKKLISKPGNQMLCGSCWAIAGAGIISDNFVVSGLVDWHPNLSTTWSLACFPQAKCKGGNPAILFNDVAKGGITSNHCIDYSWCANNDYCNGKATKHFKKKAVDLSAYIPNCGCYFGNEPHFLYFIDKNPKSLHIGSPGVTEKNVANLAKKHIFSKGPVLGGFLVFANFMSGAFTKVNKGIYLENAVYDKGEVHFDEKQVNTANYKGSHAIAVIGWGIENDVIIDNKGTKKNIPYWYCRNSWTDKWGDNGYFKIAMYPHNKIVQFEKIVRLQTPQGIKQSGGMILISASKKPVKKNIHQIQEQFRKLKRLQTDDYYKSDPNSSETGDKEEDSSSWMLYAIYVIVLIIIILIGYNIYKRFQKLNRDYTTNVEREYVPPTFISSEVEIGRAGVY